MEIFLNFEKKIILYKLELEPKSEFFIRQNQNG